MYEYELPKLTYSIREACQASSLGRTTIYAHIAAGRLPVVKVGGRTLIPAAALEALLAGEDAPLYSNPAYSQREYI
jgi:excisionase family DNA binding protein